MLNLIYFSDYFIPITEKLKFAFVVVGRFIKISFKRTKRLELIQLEYSRKFLFENSYLIIKYRFRNALWYKFKKIKTTTQKNSTVINLKSIDNTIIELIVYGFFQRKVYQISVEPENILFNQRFHTKIYTVNKKLCITPNLKLVAQKPNVKIPNIKIKTLFLKLKQSTYSQTDFI